MEVRVSRFNEADISKADWPGGNRHWFFYAGLASHPAFAGCESNYEVEARLRKAGVITRGAVTDTEYCALHVEYRTKRAALGFIERLNAYIERNRPRLIGEDW